MVDNLDKVEIVWLKKEICISVLIKSLRLTLSG